jgi:type II secretory pathway component PulF
VETWRLDLEGLTRLFGYLRTLTSTGGPLPEGLRALSRSAPEVDRALLRQLARDLEAGLQLSRSVGQRLPAVPPLVTALLRAGEKSGHLAHAVEALLAWHDAQLDLSRRIEASLAYPRMVVLVALGLALPAVGFAFSRNTGLMPNLPASTGTTIARALLVPFTAAPWIWPPIALAVFWLSRHPFGRLGRPAAWMAGRVWAVGTVRRLAHAAGFARGLSMLFAAGVPAPEAVRLLAGFAADPLVDEELAVVAQRVEAGQPLSQALSGVTVFPPALAWMMGLGERAQGLERAVDEAAGFFGREARQQADVLGAALEPWLLVGLALLFAPALIASYWPLIAATMSDAF